MKHTAPTFTRLLIGLLLALSGSVLPARDEPAQSAATPGYTVVLEVNVGPDGKPVSAEIVASDDGTADHLLEHLALGMANNLRLPPKLKDDKPVAYKVRAPFRFPVPEDEGLSSNAQPKPAIHQAVQPVYPPALASRGEVGGAIFELVISPEGKIEQLTCLRSSHPEFASAGETALRQWVFTPAANAAAAEPVRCRVALSFATTERQPNYLWRVAPRPSLGSYQVVHQVPGAAGAAKPDQPKP